MKMTGEPDAGNPQVRFDEGMQETCVRVARLRPTLQSPHLGKRLPFCFVREQVRRRLIAQRLMWPLVIVKVKVRFQRREQVLAGGEVAGVDQFVFERAPQTFDENVVECATAAIHTNGDPTLLQRSQKIGGGKLRALIGVPDFGLAEAKRGVKRG